MSSTYLSVVTLDDLHAHLNFNLKTNDYIVFEVNKANYLMQRNLLYRADYFGVLLVKEGFVRYTEGELQYVLRAGDILFTNNSRSFRIDYISDDYAALYMFFSEEVLESVGLSFVSNDVSATLLNESQDIIRNEPDLFARMEFYMLELKRLNTPHLEAPLIDGIMFHFFSLIVHEIVAFLSRTVLVMPKSPREEALSSEFFHLLKQFFRQQHDIQFYADQLFVSRKYLGRVVKKTMLRTPKEIISQMLVLESKLLLRTSKLSIQEIAYALGFTDQASFSKFFKKHTDFSPTFYKSRGVV